MVGTIVCFSNPFGSELRYQSWVETHSLAKTNPLNYSTRVQRGGRMTVKENTAQALWSSESLSKETNAK